MPSERPEADAVLTALLDAAPDAVVVADVRGRILRANRAAETLFGHSPGSLAGRAIEVLMPPAEAARHADHVRRHVETGVCCVVGVGREVEGLRADGTLFPLHVSLGRADPPGGPCFVAIMHDLTRRRSAERAIRRSERMDALGRMTGGVAHDFNNLLTIVIGNLELLEAALKGDDRELAGDALAAAELGAGLTAQLLAFARRGSLAPERLTAARAVREAVDMVRRTLGPRIAVEARMGPGGEGARIEVDRAQLGSALVNLALNARDAMPDGGRLLVETAAVEIDDDYLAQEIDVAPGRYARITVTDDGVGMDAETRARALEPFFSTKPAGRGSGFGLATVYGFVRQSGGHVTLYSEPGQGTTVGLYFPLVDAAARAAPEPGATPLGRGERVLVVEDEPAVRRVSAARIAALGYEVAQAASADEALRALETGPVPDAVFTDVVMPGRHTGADLARHVRRHHPGTAVLMTSGYAGALADRGEALPAVLRKPFRQAELARRLRDALDARGDQSSSTSAVKE